MSTELSKSYNPKENEAAIYKLWEESGFFNPDNLPRRGLFKTKKFVITIAPPNITGELHMGHALENTLVDIVVRMKRMQGYKTLWLPGTDHAGIATQNAVEKELTKEGLTRHDLGREKFIERVWQWRDKYGGIILDQLRRLGCSLDWSRTRFTMDEEYQKSVREAFLHYYEKGWIYQGYRVINWCSRCATALSDLELEHRQTQGKLYYIKYPIGEGRESAVGNRNYIMVATTRPETMLGDAAVAVNPKDERYRNLIGKKVMLPIQNREIPIIADDAVDLHFGTGAVKVTPAHSADDFEISERHKLQIFEIISKEGIMTAEAGPICEGLNITECRLKVVNELKKLNLLEKEEDFTHNVAHCERCGTIIEPLFSKQWFLKMSKLAELSKKAFRKRWIKFHPERWSKPYLEWLEKIRDWNISRQIWWGHKIPLEGVDDVLDTWFSSALWPFAVLGWPSSAKASEGTARKNDYERYYPTQFISSARDILHLWITRMVFSGIEFTGKPPFKDIYIHPTVLTAEGRRMSKSLGTGIDPINLIEKYGADAVRFGLAYQTSDLQDIHFNEDAMVMGQKFVNKIWNATRFVLTQLPASGLQLPAKINAKNLDKESKKIIADFKTITKSTTENLERLHFGRAAQELYHFFWHRFCDQYLEFSKKQNTAESKSVLLCVMSGSLKLLHPFMPFVTEKLYSLLPIKEKKLLIIEDWPGSENSASFGFSRLWRLAEFLLAGRPK